MTIYAFIPARGGSERLVNKNLSIVGGRTLVMRAFDSAVDAKVDQIVVSTDCDDIGTRFIYNRHFRPPALAGPHSQIEDAVAHWMHRCDPVLDDEDVVVLLQPTSPFRTPRTIRECVRFVEAGYDSAVTVTLEHRNTGRLRSYKNGTPMVRWNRPIDARPRSQDARQYGVENGVCWAFSAGHFRRWRLRMGGASEAAVVTSWLEAFEIDTQEDLEVARALVDVTPYQHMSVVFGSQADDCSS